VLQLTGAYGAGADVSLFSLKKLVIVLLFAAAAVGFLANSRALYYLVTVSSVLVLGFYYKVFFSVADLPRLIYGPRPDIHLHHTWYLLLGLVGLTTILWGRLYCGWLCPFGALLELLHKLSPVKARVSKSLDRVGVKIKYAVLILLPLVYIIYRSPAVFGVEPFSPLFTLFSS